MHEMFLLLREETQIRTRLRLFCDKDKPKEG